MLLNEKSEDNEKNGSEDYLNTQQEIYKGMDVDEIYKEARENWNSKIK